MSATRLTRRRVDSMRPRRKVRDVRDTGPEAIRGRD